MRIAAICFGQIYRLFLQNACNIYVESAHLSIQVAFLKVWRFKNCWRISAENADWYLVLLHFVDIHHWYLYILSVINCGQIFAELTSNWGWIGNTDLICRICRQIICSVVVFLSHSAYDNKFRVTCTVMTYPHGE